MTNKQATPFSFITDRLRKIDNSIREEISFGVPNGLYCTDLDEQYAQRNPGACEVIREGKHGQMIVLGRDRTGTLAEGAGSVGLQRAGMIDLYVGAGSSLETDKKKFDKNNRLDPLFAADAARVYITQTSMNIDDAFGLLESGRGASSEKKSAVALKADQVRIVSREKMVFFCGKVQKKEKLVGFPQGKELNSNGDSIIDVPIIEFLTGDPKNLQPVVLGDNLIEYLKEREEAHRKLVNKMEILNEQLIAVNTALAVLTVGAPPFSKNVMDGIIEVIDNVSESFNSYIKTVNSLDNASIKGAKSIVSSTVFTS